MQNCKRFRLTHSKGLMLRAMMLLMLPLSLAGCSNNLQTSASNSSDIPPLSPLAIQPQKPEFCLPSCSQNLSKEIDNWQITLTEQERRD
ncbi:lysis accessory protein RZ1 [Escherichia phage vB_EcoS_swi2]|uniref:Lysis accessory protein RZ1 n=1 Tax=Escherichia phage vB_EcoS_swi2 TaxID=2769808 RepID=A0A862QWI0_9CAUD|nr:Rz-like spanin [Escherichia phage vB_EcoS_swi2]QNR52469.1 lysis accessory protein RZ1 [Escherichia phage vB_EcoS_swi2]